MAGRDVLTTRISDTVKVEIKDPNNPHGTLPNYGNVQPVKPDHLPGSEYDDSFGWHLASGQSGTARTEQKAINAAARAIRKHAAETAPVQTAVAYVPAPIVEAVNRVKEHFGDRVTKEFYSADGEVVVHYRNTDRSGVGMIHLLSSNQGDSWVCALHTVPGNVEAGLPERFNSNVMYDTASTEPWWPVTPEPGPRCPACGNPIEGYPATSRFDNTTKICNGCGDAEAMGDWAGVKLLGPGKVDG